MDRSGRGTVQELSIHYRVANEGVERRVLGDERTLQKPDNTGPFSLPRTHKTLPLSITSTCRQGHTPSSDNTGQHAQDNPTSFRPVLPLVPTPLETHRSKTPRQPTPGQVS